MDGAATRFGDQRGLVLSWILRVLVGLGLSAVVLFDAGAAVVNYFSLDSTARDVALSVQTSLPTSGFVNVAELRAKARREARDAGARLMRLEIEGQNVTVRLRREADTLLLQRIGPLERFGVATTEAHLGPSNF